MLRRRSTKLQAYRTTVWVSYATSGPLPVGNEAPAELITLLPGSPQAALHFFFFPANTRRHLWTEPGGGGSALAEHNWDPRWTLLCDQSLPCCFITMPMMPGLSAAERSRFIKQHQPHSHYSQDQCVLLFYSNMSLVMLLFSCKIHLLGNN